MSGAAGDAEGGMATAAAAAASSAFACLSRCVAMARRVLAEEALGATCKVSFTAADKDSSTWRIMAGVSTDDILRA